MLPGKVYTTVFILALLCLHAVFLIRKVNIPPRFNKFTIWVLSPVTAVLVVEDVSRKEQNNAEELKTPEEVKTGERPRFSVPAESSVFFLLADITAAWSWLKVPVRRISRRELGVRKWELK